MRTTNQRRERGIALLLSILALLLLSAVAAGMIYTATTENSIAGNFKTEETEYFAARAGIEEARDRMIPGQTAPYGINSLMPAALPGSGNAGVIYILQNGVTQSQVITSGNPSTSGNTFDDELCHDYAIPGMSRSSTPNVRCTAQPSGTSWFSMPTGSQGVSQAPTWTSSGVSNPIDWKWTRISLKASNSTPYCVDGVNTGTNCYNQTAGIACFDGTSEQQVSAASTCAASGWNPVYLLTSLAVSSTGTRRMVQAEIAQRPQTGNQPGGLFATGTGCSPQPLSFGGNVTTGSFTSAGVSPTSPVMPAMSLTNGNVGANGGISVSGSAAAINGNVASTLPSGTSGCPLAITQAGHPTIGGETQIASPYVPTTPTIPANVPQTPCDSSHVCWTTSGSGNNAVNLLTPGTYGNISITSQTKLTLQSGTAGQPAVYNINSLTETGHAAIVLSGPPYGPVVINLAGGGVTSGSYVLDLTGGGFANNSFVSSDLTFYYGGTGSMKMSGGSGAFSVVDAPQASLTLVGNSTFYGSAVAQNITVQGASSFYWDQATVPPPTVNTNPFSIVAMRELSY